MASIGKSEVVGRAYQVYLVRVCKIRAVNDSSILECAAALRVLLGFCGGNRGRSPHKSHAECSDRGACASKDRKTHKNTNTKSRHENPFTQNLQKKTKVQEKANPKARRANPKEKATALATRRFAEPTIWENAKNRALALFTTFAISSQKQVCVERSMRGSSPIEKRAVL